MAEQYDYPFRIEGATVRTVEQDSLDEIVASVKLLLRTPVGWRAEAPDYGSPDPFGDELPDIAPALRTAILQWEPRAIALLQTNPDQFDELVATVVMELRARPVIT